MVKTPCCEKVGLKRGKWTVEEDEILVKYIQANGEGSWRSLPKNAGLLRCGKSCRLRWTNYLRPDLKRGKFTAEEDETIVKLHSTLGNRWSLIAQHLPGRTDNEIKNYWNSNLRRRIYSFRNLIKTTTNVPTMVVDGSCDESSRKRDATTTSKGGSIGGSPQKTNSLLCFGSWEDTTLSEGGSIESLLSEDNIVVDRGSTRKNNSFCLEDKEGATWFEGGSIESLLLENYTFDIGSIRKSNSACPGGKDNAMWSEENSIESVSLENYVVDICSNRKLNSSCPGGRDDAPWFEERCSFESLLFENVETNFSCSRGTCNATWFEGGSTESFLLENSVVDIGSNREINFSCLGGRDKTMWSEEGGSIEYLENYTVDIGSNRETNSSCPGGKGRAMWSEEGSSIESLLTENYIVDLEFLIQPPPHEIKGIAMHQHEHHAKSEMHEPRNEEEEEEEEYNKNNKDIHDTLKKQVCHGIWPFEEQGQQIQGSHEQNEENEIVLQQQHNECLDDFDNNWCDINFDYFLEEEYGV